MTRVKIHWNCLGFRGLNCLHLDSNSVFFFSSQRWSKWAALRLVSLLNSSLFNLLHLRPPSLPHLLSSPQTLWALPVRTRRPSWPTSLASTTPSQAPRRQRRRPTGSARCWLSTKRTSSWWRTMRSWPAMWAHPTFFFPYNCPASPLSHPSLPPCPRTTPSSPTSRGVCAQDRVVQKWHIRIYRKQQRCSWFEFYIYRRSVVVMLIRLCKYFPCFISFTFIFLNTVCWNLWLSAIFLQSRQISVHIYNMKMTP